MAPSLTWFRLCLVIVVSLSKNHLFSSALRPGGDDAVALTSAGSIVLDNGSVIEEYEASVFFLSRLNSKLSQLPERVKAREK